MTKVTLKRVKRSGPNGVRLVWMLRWNDQHGGQPGETIGDAGRVNGKGKVVSGQMSRRRAEAIRRDKQSKLDCGVIRADRPKRMTLIELIQHDRQAIADRRYKTLLGHNHAAGFAIGTIGSTTHVDRITRAHVARLKADMQDRGYSPATIDKTVRTLRAMWNRAKQDGLVLDNPFAGNGVKWDPGTSRIFSPEEIDAMLTVAADDWWRLFIRLLVTTGLRLNEALHLRWADVGLEARTVRVCRHERGTFTADGKTYPLLPWNAKAKASYRTIPLADETVAELRRRKAKAGNSRYVFIGLERLEVIGCKIQAGELRPNCELVNNVLRRFKESIQPQARALLAMRRGVKVEEVDWEIGCIHDLRDTFLTGVKDLPIDVLQRIAGHADLATTIRFYTHATERDADVVRAALASSGLAGGGSQGTNRAHLAASSA